VNLILLHSEDFTAVDRVQLKGRRYEYIQKVHKPQLGQKLRVGLLGGLIGEGELLSLRDDSLVLAVRLYEEAPPPASVKVFLALPRPKNLSRILQTLTTLGVKEMHIFHSYNVEKSFWTSDLLDEKEVRNALILGLEQARDTFLPDVQFHRYFKPFIEDKVPHLTKPWELKFLADPTGSECMPHAKATTIVVGPERGFIPYEVDGFVSQGFQVVSLGMRILKVETALTALIAKLY
jgi:RsmE family RNA methyltransferase